MIGPRVGAKVGPRVGPAVGPAADEVSAGVAITKDATSNIYIPQNASEWTALMALAGLATGGPSAVYTFQDASGNPVDSVGGFTLTAAGTGISYQNAVTGWSSKAINTTAAGTGSLTATAAGLPDPSTTSVMVLSYVNITSSVLAGIHGYGALSTRQAMEATATPRLQAVSGANLAGGTNSPINQVRPLVTRYNFTASTALGASDQEKLVPTFTATTTKNLVYGNFGRACAAAQYLYSAVFFGPAAEQTDAQLKTMLQTLGWSIPWT
jgi:hypothetical protein